MKRLALAFCLATPLCVSAAEKWVEVSSGKNVTYKVRVGSVRVDKNKAGRPIVVGLFSETKDSGGVVIEQNYVTLSDCAGGFGKLVTLDTSGSVRYETDFAFGAAQVASTIAELLCLIGKKEADKGI